MLERPAFWASRQMTPGEESLAADLARSGASAWGHLQEQLTSTADCLWDESTGERKTLVELRALAHSPDRSVREKAYRKEMDVCERISVPVAAALNGVKGTNITLNTRRGWPGGAFDAAIENRFARDFFPAKRWTHFLPSWKNRSTGGGPPGKSAPGRASFLFFLRSVRAGRKDHGVIQFCRSAVRS